MFHVYHMALFSIFYKDTILIVLIVIFLVPSDFRIEPRRFRFEVRYVGPFRRREKIMFASRL
jgi:hypothetical protein